MAYPKNLVECILKLFPDAKVDIDFACEHPKSGLRISEWNLPDPEPTEDELNAVAPAVQAEWDGQEYARDRREAYPDWQTQLDKIYDDGLTKWKTDMVDPVKAAYPKP